MGRIIRSSGRVIPAAVADEWQAVAHARAEAEASRARAQAAADAGARAAETALAAAREAGYAEGLREGRAAAAAEAATLLASAAVEAEALRRQAAAATMPVARRMAEIVVGRTLALEPAVAVDIAARALAELRATVGVVSLSCHPDDVPALEAARARLEGQLQGEGALRLESDADIARGGCVVKTRLGHIDARLATQLDALERALAARLAPATEGRASHE